MRLTAKLLILFTTTLLAVGTHSETSGQTDREHFKHNPDDGLPFSDAVRVGDTLYISGSGGFEPGTTTIPDDPRKEARNLMEHYVRTLALAGMTVDDLVSVTVYCPDLSLYGVFNEVYRSYFKGPLPARAFIGTAPLLLGMRFEMQGIAVRR